MGVGHRCPKCHNGKTGGQMSSKHPVMEYDPGNQIVNLEVKYAGRIQKNSLKMGQDQMGPGWVTQ